MMNRILTKALMKYHNDFFKMSDEEQELFKLQDHDELDKKIRMFVYKELGIDENSNDPLDSLAYNSTMLPYHGIGENNFALNEFDWNEKIFTFKNLYEYNKNYHEYQETALSEDENLTDYKPGKLYNRFNSWARVFVDKKFHYLNLFSIQIWLYWSLEEFSHAWIEKQIPHDYVTGKDNGKKTEGGYLWDTRLDAHGLEGWYEQISDFSNNYLNEKHDNTKDMCDKVFIVDTSSINEPSLDYIFGSLNILNDITFKNFVKDCDNVKGDTNDLMAYKDTELMKFEKALEKALEEIKKTPPNVVKLKKKMKIVMSNEVLLDLSDLEE